MTTTGLALGCSWWKEEVDSDSCSKKGTSDKMSGWLAEDNSTDLLFSGGRSASKQHQGGFCECSSSGGITKTWGTRAEGSVNIMTVA